MSELTKLSNECHTILLAEIAALLHNIGKLDPNFLVQHISDEDKSDALKKLQGYHVDIPNYQIKHFVVPRRELFITELQALIFDRDEQEIKSIELRKKLAKLDVWIDEERQNLQELLDDSEEEKIGFYKHVLEAPQRIVSLRRGNGVLCFRYSGKRDELHRRLVTQEKKAAHLNRKVQTVPLEKKSTVGRQLSEANDEIAKTKESLDQLDEHEVADQKNFESQMRGHQITINKEDKEQWSIGDLLTVFWENFFYKEDTEEGEDNDYTRKFALKPWLKPKQGTSLPGLLILSHGEISGSEKGSEQRETNIEPAPKSPKWEQLRSATAFGYDQGKIEKMALQDARHSLIQKALKACKNPANERDSFLKTACNKLEMGLGDTQWPINEINLWDFSSSIAALFKSGVARGVLEGKIPSVGDMHWRFLSVRFDGLSYLSQVHHVTDLIGRRKAVENALNAVQKFIEETYPLGNEIYRDENGAVFVVPDLSEQESILSLKNGDGTTLETLLNQVFASDDKDDGAALAGELVPRISLGDAQRGKQLQLGKYLYNKPLPLGADPAKVAQWWRGEPAEICTVCGIRPMGYKPEGAKMPQWVKSDKAEKRHLCCVCLHRRERRAKDWLQKKLQSTIWADEVVDVNGRFALLVGQFDLSMWLDSTLIATMQKPTSFARIRRCWETTQEFWENNSIIISGMAKRQRLAIKPQTNSDLNLGKYHTYELVIGGQEIGVVWDPETGRLIFTEYLRDLARRLALPGEPWKRRKGETEVDVENRIASELWEWLESQAKKNTDGWSLLEPSGYDRPAAETGQKVKLNPERTFVDGYFPHILLLSEPALFMTLIPADKAMQVVQAIKEKYEREMSKVQDRLPLHLGVVIAKRRTPLRAVLDAGRAMLDRRGGWQEWRVIESDSIESDNDNKEATEGNTPDHLQTDAHFIKWQHIRMHQGAREISMRVAKMMGDGKTPDQWHTHFLTREPLPNDEFEDKPWKSPSELKKDDKVYIAPSSFDFEYLDTTARRFEIAYDDNGQRLGRPTRPYYLGEIEQLQKVWEIISAQMSSTQWMHITELIERKRHTWQQPRGVTDEYSETFEQFISDTLYNIEWKEKPKKDDWALLERAALYGILDDVIDLYHEALKEPEEA